MGIKKRRAEHKEKEEAMAAMMLISDNILSQIFIRIHDCRSLLRCTTVCKAWFSIINSDHFRHEKQKQSKPCTLLFTHGHTHKLTKPLPYQYFSEESQTLHQKNTDNTNIIHSQDDYYLNFLPWPEVRLLSVTDDLLLLSLWRRNADFARIIFSSETGEWSNIIAFPYQLLWDQPPIICNGMIHWLSLIHDTLTADGIIACDPFHEDPNYYNFIQFPLDFPQDERRKYCINIRLGLVQGRLRISLTTFITKKRRVYSVKVWELNYDNNNGDDGKTSSWCLVHDFEKSGIGFNSKYVVVMAFHPTNGDVLFILFDNIHVYQYDIREDKMEKVYQFPHPGYHAFGMRLQHFPIVYPFWPTKIPALTSSPIVSALDL
ncbi:hypothetical protein G4B88_019451 [Cannabis sativa]|uniref:F-box domain-containing protein n=1 Tax=Cannabis sativa TaxID=3483 RepID=A0A7J6HY75_CANSA|nr:hypothetical protein G4B88_019451 [Cannabis sativa]